MTDEADFSAFGYRPQEGVFTPIGLQVAEAKDPGTLAPTVILWFRLTEDSDQIGLAMSPDSADFVADELRRWASRAREKHWEPPDGPGTTSA
jgi:hypothetical protein